MKYLRTYYGFLVAHKWEMLPFLILVTLSVVVESLPPYWLKRILDAAQYQNQSGIYLYLALFGFSTIGGNLIAALSYYLGDRILIPFARHVREVVFQRVLELDFAFHVNRNTGSLISAFKRGDGAVFDLFLNLHQDLYRVLIYLAVALYFLSTVSLEMAAILLVLFIANSRLIWYLISVNLQTRTDFNNAEDEVAGVITDSLINYETVKFFAAEQRERRRLSDRFVNWTTQLWRFSNSYRLMDITIGTTSGIGLILILYLAISRLGDHFTLGDLVMVSGFLTSFYYQFFNLFFRARNVAKNMTDLEKYFSILDHQVAVTDPVSPRHPSRLSGRVDFSGLTFSYPQDPKPTLSGVNLTIPAGKTVAFVGKSGAGKTTLIKLLLRFYDPTAGTIKLGGQDIRDFSKSQLRSYMGVVPQEPIMFNNSIRFNLAYGRPAATQSELDSAARQANILDFIRSLPQRWDTQVGERGIKLSGGQKQRLAIARAILARPKVLIFDEATSNLDSESEGKIQSALAAASRHRTVIIIAHRFSTIRNVDQIFVLKSGRVAETGTHSQLLSQGGEYAHLWALQARGQLESDPDSASFTSPSDNLTR